MRLDVYLEHKLIGYLFTDSRYGLSFEYCPDADKKISISIPLSDKVYRRGEAEPFFSGLLPDIWYINRRVFK